MLSIQQLQTSGTAVTVHCRDSRLEESGDAARIQQSATTTGLPLDESGAVATIQEPAITTGHGGTETAPAQGEQSQSFVPRGTNRHHCGQRRCDCLCHLKGKKAGAFLVCGVHTPLDPDEETGERQVWFETILSTFPPRALELRHSIRHHCRAEHHEGCHQALRPSICPMAGKNCQVHISRI